MSKREEKFTFTYRLAIFAAKVLFHTLYPVRYHDVERVQMDAPFILIGNHNSMLDPMIVGLQCKRYQVRFLGKKELTKSAFLRRLFKSLDMITVDRHNMDLAAVRACLKTLKDNHVLGIFPEGTRHKTTVMEELESGTAMIALRSDVPLLPVYITEKPRLFHRIDCYYGEPIRLEDILAKGISRETCEETQERITETYRAMIKAHDNFRNSHK